MRGQLDLARALRARYVATVGPELVLLEDAEDRTRDELPGDALIHAVLRRQRDLD